MSNLNIQVFVFINVARWPSKNSVKKILTLKPVAAPVEAFGGSKSSASHSASDILTKKKSLLSKHDLGLHVFTKSDCRAVACGGRLKNSSKQTAAHAKGCVNSFLQMFASKQKFGLKDSATSFSLL